MQPLFHKRKTITGVRKLKKISMSTVLVLEEAEKLGIEWEKLRYTDLFKLSYQGIVKYFHGQTPSETTEFAYYCCKKKQLAKSILSDAGISVSDGYLIKHTDTREYKLKLFNSLQKPVVVKPADDQSGNNVHINISTAFEFEQAIETIYQYNGTRPVQVIVEEMFVGDEFRVLATQTMIVSAIKRIRANVTGDGVSTIHELIQEKNEDPIRKKIQTYKQIEIDHHLLDYVAEQHLSLATVPARGERVFLRPSSPLDITHGGDTIDYTETLHPSVKKILINCMKQLPGLSLAGIDFMSTDITKQQTKDSYSIIEVNASPSLDWNQFPLIGKKRNVAYQFLKIMFPSLQ